MTDLFSSPVINRNDLFQSHKVKRSGLSKYNPMMTKQQAYSKLSRGNKNIEALIADKSSAINILKRNQAKYPYRKNYDRAITEAQAEKDALQAKLDLQAKDRQDLLRFTTAYAGRMVPADVITQWYVGKPLPYRLTAPEQVPEANPVVEPSLSNTPIYQPTTSGGEAMGSLPSVSSGGVPFQPQGSQISTEAETGQGTPQATLPSPEPSPEPEETEPSPEPEETDYQKWVKSAGPYEYNPYGGGSSANDTTDLSDIDYGMGNRYYQSDEKRFLDEYYKKHPKKPLFLPTSGSSEEEQQPRPRRKKKEPKPPEVVIKKEDQIEPESPDQSSGESDKEPEGNESPDSGGETAKREHLRMMEEPELRQPRFIKTGETSSSSGEEPVKPKPEPVKEVKGESSGSDYLSEKLKKVNAKEVEKYLKSYRVPFKQRGDFTTKFPKGNYVKYLNDLIKDDPEFWKYHNVVKKK